MSPLPSSDRDPQADGTVAPVGNQTTALDKLAPPSRVTADSPLEDRSPQESSDPWTLSNRQVLALKCLANGVSITDAAITARVSRATVHRWITEHPAFRAAYNRWKSACQLSAQTQLIALQELAVEVVNEQLEKHRNGSLAAQLLTKLGAMAASPPGAIEPKRAAKEIETERLHRDVELARSAGEVRTRYCPSEHLVRDDPPAAPPQDAAAGKKRDSK